MNIGTGDLISTDRTQIKPSVLEQTVFYLYQLAVPISDTKEIVIPLEAIMKK